PPARERPLFCAPHRAIVRSAPLPPAALFRRQSGATVQPASPFRAAPLRVRSTVPHGVRAPLRALDDTAPCSRPALFARRRPPSREPPLFRVPLRTIARSA